MNDSRETKKVVGTRRLKEAMAKPASLRILTVANQKGGVGKTTTTVNLAAALSMGGLKVVVIDLDPQGNASTALGVEHLDNAGIYEVLMGDSTMSQVVQKVAGFPSLECVSSSTSLAQAEIELVPMVAREMRLKEAIEELVTDRAAAGETIDYIFIDCPPSLGLLTINAFTSAKEVLIPIQCEYYSLEGLSQLLKTFELVKKRLNPSLKLSTLAFTINGANSVGDGLGIGVSVGWGDGVMMLVASTITGACVFICKVGGIVISIGVSETGRLQAERRKIMIVTAFSSVFHYSTSVQDQLA